MMKKRLPVLLLLLFCLTLSLFGCEKGGAPADTSAPAETAAETEAPPAPEQALDLIVSGACKFTVIRGDTLASSNEAVKSALRTTEIFTEYTTRRPDLGTDWSRDGSHEDKKDRIEILVGPTNYAETRQVASELDLGEYAVRMVGNKIVLFAFTPENLDRAVDLFADFVDTAARQEADGSWTVSLRPKDILTRDTGDRSLSGLPSCGGSYLSYYDPGDSCREFIFNSVSEEGYRAYVDALTGAGYEIYTSREVNGNSFATLYNKDYTLNVGYYAYDSAVRLITEKYTKKTLIGLEADNAFTPVTTSQITMLGLEYQSGSTTADLASNGQSIVIRLTDGRFVIVDGGFNRAAQANLLVNTLKEQAPDKNNITVAAWIVTHAHSDHYGLLVKQNSVIKSNRIRIERFLVNFMSETERIKAINSAEVGKNWDSGTGGSIGNVYTAGTTFGADVIPVHVGQIFHLADLDMEVLYTIESFGPAECNAMNTTSVIMKMTFTDPVTKKQTVYMSTGDGTGPAFLICHKMYGDYLKSDIVQVAHHGATTWGTENGTISAYKDMAPATLLWPVGTYGKNGYEAKKNNSYNIVLWSTSVNKNYKETYLAGWEGTVTTLPLPYTPGTGTVKETKPNW